PRGDGVPERALRRDRGSGGRLRGGDRGGEEAHAHLGPGDRPDGGLAGGARDENPRSAGRAAQSDGARGGPVVQPAAAVRGGTFPGSAGTQGPRGREADPERLRGMLGVELKGGTRASERFLRALTIAAHAPS